MNDFQFDELLKEASFNPAPVVEPPTDITGVTTEDDDIVLGDITPEPDQVEPAVEGQDDTTDDSPLTAYYEFLQEQEYLDLPEDFQFDGTPEKFQEALDLTKKATYDKTAQAFFEHLPDDFKPLLTYALKGGESVDDFIKLYSTQEFERLDPTKEEDQKAILFQYYKQQNANYDDAKIHRIIARLNEDDLPEAAQESYNELLEQKAERQAQLIQKAEADNQARAEDNRQKVEALNKAIETTNLLDDNRRTKVKGFFFNRLTVNGGEPTTEFNHTIQQIFSNPEHQAQLADILLDYDPKKGLSTKRFEQKGATKETTKFKTLIETKLNSKPKASHTGATNADPAGFLERFNEL